jgi:hypothetical protein
VALPGRSQVRGQFEGIQGQSHGHGRPGQARVVSAEQLPQFWQGFLSYVQTTATFTHRA